MEAKIPRFLYDLLITQYGKEITNKIIAGYAQKRAVTLRANSLKKANIKEILTQAHIHFTQVPWNKDALILEQVTEQEIRKLPVYENGEVYLQSLSSMLPVIALDPKENENILDMTAAPGGKTTQMAAITENKAFITACEKNKVRSERLKYNVEKQGATCVNILTEDARNLNSYFSFDKILLDAPCSGSGTLYLEDEKLEKTFTEELIRRSVKTQYELLKKAVSILKKGQEMVYSTCSILEIENENNIRKLLANSNVEIVPIDLKLFKDIPLLPVKLQGTVAVCPSKLYEGFFIAKLRKI